MKRLLLAVVLLVAVTGGCRAWKPKPWVQTLIDIEVSRDTVPQPSLLLQGARWLKTTHVDKRSFRCGPYWVPEPPLLFQREDDLYEQKRIRRGDYHTADFVGDLICDIIDCFFL